MSSLKGDPMPWPVWIPPVIVSLSVSSAEQENGEWATVYSLLCRYRSTVFPCKNSVYNSTAASANKRTRSKMKFHPGKWTEAYIPIADRTCPYQLKHMHIPAHFFNWRSMIAAWAWGMRASCSVIIHLLTCCFSSSGQLAHPHPHQQLHHVSFKRMGIV